MYEMIPRLPCFVLLKGGQGKEGGKRREGREGRGAGQDMRR